MQPDWIFGVFGPVVDYALAHRSSGNIWEFLNLIRTHKVVPYKIYGPSFATIIDFDANLATITQFGPCNSLDHDNPLMTIGVSRDKSSTDPRKITRTSNCESYCIDTTEYSLKRDFIITRSRNGIISGHSSVESNEVIVPKILESIKNKKDKSAVDIRGLGCVYTTQQNTIDKPAQEVFYTPLPVRAVEPVEHQEAPVAAIPKHERPKPPKRGGKTKSSERLWKRGLLTGIALIALAGWWLSIRGESVQNSVIDPIPNQPPISQSIKECYTFGTGEAELKVREAASLESGFIDTIPDGTRVVYTRVIKGDHPFLEVRGENLGYELDLVFVSALHCLKGEELPK
jgi:hypothetical protein